MNKYMVWTSDTQGVYIRADKVVETDSEISFIRQGKLVDEVVETYKKTDIKEYMLVE